MTELNIEVVKRKAGCEHRVTYIDGLSIGTVKHDGKERMFQKFNDADMMDGRPWVTEVIEWIRGLHT